VLVVGAGGHAKVCIESLVDAGHTVVGTVSREGVAVEGFPVPVLGTDAEVAEVAAAHGAEAVFVAVGDNAGRAAVRRKCVAVGLVEVTAVSRFALVSRSAELEGGAAVMAGAVVNASARVCAGAIVNSRASVDHDCVVGADAHVAPGAVVAGGVTIGAGALVGVGAKVLPNLTVGDGAVVGGGAMVVADVPAGATVMGVPARVVAG
jgi:UDP-perosamine 4-acetyltransferase